jgi:hypothetical protein
MKKANRSGLAYRVASPIKENLDTNPAVADTGNNGLGAVIGV